MAMSAVAGPAPLVASLIVLSGSVGGGRGRGRLLSAGGTGKAPCASTPRLRSSFLSSPALPFLSSSTSSSFSGLSLGMNSAPGTSAVEKRRRGLVVRAGRKYTLGQTKRNRSRKSLARTHGFRRRMRTTSGRAVLRRRRAKGRQVLCTKTNPTSGKRR